MYDAHLQCCNRTRDVVLELRDLGRLHNILALQLYVKVSTWEAAADTKTRHKRTVLRETVGGVFNRIQSFTGLPY
jgi:hypothetical protein